MSKETIAKLREDLAAEKRAVRMLSVDADEARAARNVAIEQRDAAIARATAAERALAAVQSALPISDADLDRLIALLGPYGAFAAAPRSFGGPPPTQLMRDVGAAIEGELRRRGLLPFTSSENLK